MTRWTSLTSSAGPGARDLITFCRRLELPFGINVESVTIRKVEIEASVELAREVRGLLGRS